MFNNNQFSLLKVFSVQSSLIRIKFRQTSFISSFFLIPIDSCPAPSSAPIDIPHRVSSSQYIIYERSFELTSRCHFLSLLAQLACHLKGAPRFLFSALWQFGWIFHIHFHMKYWSTNGWSWQLIRQVREREEITRGAGNKDSLLSSCSRTPGMNEANGRTVNVGPN